MESIILAGASGRRLWLFPEVEFIQQLMLNQNESPLQHALLQNFGDYIIRYEDCYGRV